MKSLLEISSLTKQEILDIFNQASIYLTQKTDDVLSGKQIVIGFFESSTRTRISFELAVNRMGAKSISFSSQGSSVSKGESFVDTLHTLHQYGVDGWIIRHNHALAPTLAMNETQSPIINAGDGAHQHPTQALLDLFTLSRHWEDIQEKNVLIVGDILHSRVARSNIDLLSMMGCRVGFCAPGTLLPNQLGNNILFPTISQGMEWADAVIMLRIQKERMSSGIIPSEEEYRRYFGMNERLIQAYPDVLILHPGPANYGLELTMECMNHQQVLIREQVKNGLAIRMAVLKHCFL
jgi:aspartate carbamoyltransferase catalytic subunit